MNDNPFKEVKKILDAAEKITDLLIQKTNFNSDLIYYEEIFFFYYLNDISLTIIDAPVELQTRILPSLKKVMLLTKLPRYNEYEEFIDILIAFRAKHYSQLLFKYNEKITVDFLIEAFHYQSELIVFVQENDVFMHPKTPPCSFSEWIKKAAQDECLQLITKTLADNIDIILDFINPLAIEIVD